MLEELIKVLSAPVAFNSLRHVSIVHSNLKSDFFNKLNSCLTSSGKHRSGGRNSVTASLKRIDFSRNQIEDRGLTSLINCLINNQVNSIANVSHLKEIHLSKCSLTSKSVNQMFAALSFDNSLTHLDVSHNSLRDEPQVRIAIYTVKTKSKKSTHLRKYFR
jgi:hypothetical protein